MRQQREAREPGRSGILLFTIALLCLTLLLLLAAPRLGLGTLTFTFLLAKFIVLTQSFNLIAGYVGYVSFGHVAFFGIGGYVASIPIALLRLEGALQLLPMLGGGLGAALAAWLIGLPILKLRGAYFAIATIALNEALRVIVYNIPEGIAGGSFGIPLPSLRNPQGAFYGMVLLAAILFAVVLLLTQTRFGIMLKAIREDEEAAMALGIRAPRCKVLAFALSAFFMGLAGSLDTQFLGYIYPESAFYIETNIQMIAMTMLGGGGTILGPLLGTVLLYVMEDVVWAQAPFSHLILLGLLLIFILLFLRRGILGTLEDRYTALRGRFL